MDATLLLLVAAALVVVALVRSLEPRARSGGKPIVRPSAWDFARVHRATGMSVFAPGSVEELQGFVRSHAGPLCVRGAGYSHGGQTLVDGGAQVDMSRIAGVSYDAASRQVTLGGGCTWRDAIAELSEHGRTVAEMQSYHNFSVGGSIAVNCHGRGMRYGSVSDTVVAMEVLVASGEVLSCSRTTRYDLFSGTIGGYSLLGIVVEATLLTVPNDVLRLEVSTRPSNRVAEALAEATETAALFNANLYPGRYDDVVSFSWVPVVATAEGPPLPLPLLLLQPVRSRYWGCMALEQLARRLDCVKLARAHLEPALTRRAWAGRAAHRSFVIADDANKLGVLARRPSTTVLQEYFVPVREAQRFVDAIVPTLSELNVLNVSLRYVRRVTHSVMSYAPEDMVSVVLYVNIWNGSGGLKRLARWTAKTLETAHSMGGTFYLPYLLAYEAPQVLNMRSYTEAWPQLLALKAEYDPGRKFRNAMYEHLCAPPTVKATDRTGP